jgi:hypothetical protein
MSEQKLQTTPARAKRLSLLIDAAESILAAARKIHRLSVGGALSMTNGADTLSLSVPVQKMRGGGGSTPARLGSLFAVAVTQNGGSDGTDTAAPTYTYDVEDLAGTSLATAAAVTWARGYGAVVPATHGMAYYNSDGDLVLYQVDETPETDDCT